MLHEACLTENLVKVIIYPVAVVRRTQMEKGLHSPYSFSIL